ncbi:conserved hypothetical protein [Histoplasma capsulatum var. duboisii H88]|uniref:Uncharacterized protein n=1 Tax=Ajellomyces capsulatus (strain H88) TaxID=544711 RepID=F0U9Z1_AJEC8|nr:conserved hypothetical protein [Histoplasma capsulatum var. duboisii H88]
MQGLMHPRKASMASPPQLQTTTINPNNTVHHQVNIIHHNKVTRNRVTRNNPCIMHPSLKATMLTTETAVGAREAASVPVY